MATQLMSRRVIRALVTTAVAVAVAVVVMVWLINSATFGPNGSSSASDLPAGWWLIFGMVSVGVGLLAALVVDALFGGPRTRR
jgi:hypothetical protein